MHFYVFARVWLCICACLRVLRYSLSLFLSVLSSLLFSHSFHSHSFALFSFSVLSLPYFHTSFTAHTRAHILSARLSLLYFSDIFRVRSLLSMYRYLIRVFLRNLIRPGVRKPTRDRTKIIIDLHSIPHLELLVDSFHPSLRPLARVYCRLLSLISFINPFFSSYLSLSFSHRYTFTLCLSSPFFLPFIPSLSLSFSLSLTLCLSVFLSVSICGESSPKILYMCCGENKMYNV